MSERNIHNQAIVEPGAVIGTGVTIEPFAVVKGNAVIEDGATIKSHAYIDGYSYIGEGTTIYPFACIGTKTQDLKYQGEKTFVKVGKNSQIREYVTINSSCREGSVVSVGDGCLIMAYCHIAHNCSVGNHVIMSNGATLAGHVIVEDHAIIGGLTGIHQFANVGKYSMIGGMSRVTHDVPPFTLGGGAPYKLGGLNLIGLKRHGFTLETRIALSKAFKILYCSKLKLDTALGKIENEIDPLPEVVDFVDFCRNTKRGVIGLQGVTNLDEEYDSLEEIEDLAKV